MTGERTPEQVAADQAAAYATELLSRPVRLTGWWRETQRRAERLARGLTRVEARRQGGPR